MPTIVVVGVVVVANRRRRETLDPDSDCRGRHKAQLFRHHACHVPCREARADAERGYEAKAGNRILPLTLRYALRHAPVARAASP